MNNLVGKVAVVTGASRGVGKGIAEGLAEQGATVYLTGRTQSFSTPPQSPSLQATADIVNELGGVAVPVVIDHNDDSQVEALFEKIRDEQGHLDVLVNNAYQIPNPPVFSGGFWEHPISIWDDQCGVGLRGYYVASVFAAQLMVQRNQGLIINISSRGGDEYVFSACYGVGKAGVDRMAKDMAIELREHSIAAISLRPSAVKTEFVMDAVSKGNMQLDPERAEHPRFSGRCVAALAGDPNVAEKTGGTFTVKALAREYGFFDLDDDD